MNEATSKNKQKLSNVYLVFNQACPVKIREYEFKRLTEEAMKVNKEIIKKENISTLNCQKKDGNIYIQLVPENMVSMDTDLFIQKFSEAILNWKNIIKRSKRKLKEIFFLMNILEYDSESISEKKLNDLFSWLLWKNMYPKLEHLKLMCCNERIYFIVFKIPSNQQERCGMHIKVRHIDVQCIK